MLYFDGGALLKRSGKNLEIEGRWSHTLLNVRLPAIDFVVWLSLKNMLSIKVGEEEILVSKIV